MDDEVDDGAFSRLLMAGLILNARLFSLVSTLTGMRVVDKAILMLDPRRDTGEL